MSFEERIEQIRILHKKLMTCTPVTKDNLPREMVGSGVYLFSDSSKHFYVGRSKNVRKRVMQHSRASVKDAPFAFKRAREATGKLPTYRTQGSRTQLLADPKFRERFADQKHWIETLEIRYVHVEDPVNQALLEIYSSDVLDTPHNDFNTT